MQCTTSNQFWNGCKWKFMQNANDLEKLYAFSSCRGDRVRLHVLHEWYTYTLKSVFFIYIFSLQSNKWAPIWTVPTDILNEYENVYRVLEKSHSHCEWRNKSIDETCPVDWIPRMYSCARYFIYILCCAVIHPVVGRTLSTIIAYGGIRRYIFFSLLSFTSILGRPLSVEVIALHGNDVVVCESDRCSCRDITHFFLISTTIYVWHRIFGLGSLNQIHNTHTQKSLRNPDGWYTLFE